MLNPLEKTLPSQQACESGSVLDARAISLMRMKVTLPLSATREIERERERERERARERAFTNVAHSAFVTTVTLLIASAYFLECSACVYLIWWDIDGWQERKKGENENNRKPRKESKAKQTSWIAFYRFVCLFSANINIAFSILIQLTLWCAIAMQITT